MSTNKASVFSVKSSFKRGSSKLGLGDISTAILGVVLLATPALSSNIINAYIQVFYRNIDLLLYTELAQSFWLLNLIPKVVGGVALATVVIKFIRSRYRVDQQKVKLQLGKFLTFTSIICLIFSLFMAFDVPLAEAQTLATTGYILDVPFSSYDWLIGKYGNGNYYAVNGSNWDNMVGGVGSTAWSAYTGNSTALVEQVLAACTSGHILLKDVEFDYGLTIPENVTVTERNNGLDRTFINSADSQGSTYTISVDTVQTSYYMAQDGMGRFIDEFTSLVATNVINNATAQGGGHIQFSNGIFVCPVPILQPNNCVIKLSSKTIIQLADGANCNLIQNSAQTGNTSTGNSNLQIIGEQGSLLDGNKANQVYGTDDQTLCNINYKGVNSFTIQGVQSVNAAWNGIFAKNSSYGTIKNCNASFNDEHGIIAWESYNITINQNIANSNSRGGIDLHTVSNCSITENKCIDNGVADSSDGGIILHTSCYFNTIALNEVSYFTQASEDGIKTRGLLSNNKIVDNTISNCRYGISVVNDADKIPTLNSVIGNTVVQCYEGIFLLNTYYSSVIGNTVSSCNDRGILVQSNSGLTSYWNKITSNMLSANGGGMTELQTGGGTANYNTFIDNSVLGTGAGNYLVLVGNNTHAIGCWNQTTWVATWP